MATPVTLHTRSGVEIEIDRVHLLLSPTADFRSERPCLSSLGVVRLFSAASTPSRALVAQGPVSGSFRLLDRSECDIALSLKHLAACSPFLLKELILCPESEEATAALAELSLNGTACHLEREVARRERELAAKARAGSKARIAYSLNSKRTTAMVRRSALGLHFAAAVSAKGLQFGGVDPDDFASPACSDRVFAEARARLHERGCGLQGMNLFHASLSLPVCRRLGVLGPDDANAHAAGRMSAATLELLAQAVEPGDPVFLFSVASSRSEASGSTPGSPTLANPNGAKRAHHRDDVFIVFSHATRERRAQIAQDLGALECDRLLDRSSKHGARGKLCVALARAGHMPCPQCHGSKALKCDAAFAAEAQAVRDGSAKGDAIAEHWTSAPGPAFEAFVCKCAHPSAKSAAEATAPPPAKA